MDRMKGFALTETDLIVDFLFILLNDFCYSAWFRLCRLRENNMIDHSEKSGESPVNSESTKPGGGITRRDFVKYSAGTVACLYLGALNTGCGGGTTAQAATSRWLFSRMFISILFMTRLLFLRLSTRTIPASGRVFFRDRLLGPSSRGGDTNYQLLVLALSGIKQNLGASPLVIFTGDILGHGIAANVLSSLLWNLEYGPATDAADVAAMKAFTDKVVAFFMDQVRAAVGNIPVMFAVGNGDSYSGVDRMSWIAVLLPRITVFL